LFDGIQFHLAIENTGEPNYFTEKICDCFRTKTVPVYWGCPNIAEFFDAEGIIQFIPETEVPWKELINLINKLTPGDYTRRIAAVNKNYELVKNYCHIEERIQTVIRSFLQCQD
jgi:hypothetical protein